MKHVFLLMLFISFNVHSQQGSDTMHSITYISSGKYYKNWDSPKKEYTRLLIYQNKAIYQIYNVMCLDTLKLRGVETSSDRNNFFSFNNYTIETSNDSITYSELLGNSIYRYKEVADFNWVIKDDKKKIGGYNCKKATLDYGGRSWTAWYAPDVPLPFGPYKFGGLPGLIINMEDATGDYSFELYANVIKDKKPLFKLYQSVERGIIVTDREDFNRLKYKYNSLSLGEKSRFRNGANSDKEFKQVNAQGEEINFRENANYKNLNFIEIAKF
jgi:GLPGLI family protein